MSTHLDSPGARLRAARETLFSRTGESTTQGQLGELIGKTGAAISAYETGESKMPLDVVPVLADALGVRREWLAWNDGEMTEERPRRVAESRVEFPKVAEPTKPFVVGKGKKKPKQA